MSLRHDAKHGDAMEAIAHAIHGLGLRWGHLAEVANYDHALLGGGAAEAGIDLHAVLLFGQLTGQTFRDHQMHLLSARIDDANAAAVGVELLHHAVQEAAAHLIYFTRLVEKSRHIVEWPSARDSVRANCAVLFCTRVSSSP